MFLAAMLELTAPLMQYAIFGVDDLIVALLITSIVASAAGTGASVYSQRQSAEAAEEVAEHQRAYWKGLKEAENRRFAILKAQTRGRQAALFAKGGVDPDAGTPMEIMGVTQLELERSRRLAEFSIMASGQAREFSAQSAAARLRMGAIGTGFAGGAQIFQTAAIGFGPGAGSNQVEFTPNLPALNTPPNPAAPTPRIS